MKYKTIYKNGALALFLILSSFVFSQNVGINTTGSAPSVNAILDLNTGNSNNLGLIIPNVTLGASLATFNPPIANAATAGDVGMIVYNSVATNQAIGYYYWNGATWVKISTFQGLSRHVFNISTQAPACTNNSYVQLSTVTYSNLASTTLDWYQIVSDNCSYFENNIGGRTLTNFKLNGWATFLTAGDVATTGTFIIGVYKYSLGTANQSSLANTVTPILLGSVTITTAIAGNENTYSLTIPSIILAQGDMIQIIAQNTSGGTRVIWEGGQFEFYTKDIQ